MEDLIDLISILTRKRLSKIEILDKSYLSANDSLFAKLYNAIENGQVKSDNDAEMFLYGSATNSVKFRQLKSRFRKRALNTLFFLDLNDAIGKNPINKAFFELNHINHINQILLKYSSTRLAIKIITDNYSKALEYNAFTILQHFSSILLSYYSFNGMEKKFKEEEQRLKSYFEKSKIEIEANLLYNKTAIFFKRKGNSKNPQIIKREIEKFEKEESLNSTYETKYFVIRTNLLFYENIGDLDKVLAYCQMADELFKKYPKFALLRQRGMITLYKLKVKMTQKEYSDGLEILKKSELLYEVGTTNWFLLYEFKFLLTLKKSDLEKAEEIKNYIMKHPNFKSLISTYQEKWIIFDGYLTFYKQFKSSSNFSFNYPKFINNLPSYSQDKVGFNFAIRILEVLFVLGKKDFPQFMQMADALKTYRLRYLTNKDMSQRNNLFLKMILQIEPLNFDIIKIEQKVSKDLIKLNDIKTRFNADEWEIIPYEDLWLMIKKILS